jgi:predicted ATPase
MIKTVKLSSFKRFREQTFEIPGNIVLAGPNNSGKTTLFQAIAVWNLALQRWLRERGPESGSKARKRTGVAITRKDFTAIPLREMNLLWTDCSTALSRDELEEGQKVGTPRVLKILINGSGVQDTWSLGFEFTYQSSELIYARPSADTPIDGIYESIRSHQIVHVPPFSGIGPEETHYDRAYQDLLIGQGKPGDILRNLLLDVSKLGKKEWDELCAAIKEIFGYQLLDPSYEGRPYILCEYSNTITKDSGRRSITKLDIASAGSGFLQVLMLLGFFYARPASVLLLDEPDAHLHVVLQKQVYDRLRDVARLRGSQLIIATHSEVLVDNTSPERIVSFFREPHKLVENMERDQVREALKRLTSLDVLLADQAPGILYVEGETDLNLLREWARILNHPVYKHLSKTPLWHSNQGRHPKEARAHFFALQAVKPDITGVLLLDGDYRTLPDRELVAPNFTILRWKRYEAESYLLHPKALLRFVQGSSPNLFTYASAEQGSRFLQDQLPPAVLNNPLGDYDYLAATPASKTLLPGFFAAAGIPLTKEEYYQIAKKMEPSEIPDEVNQKLTAIYEALLLKEIEGDSEEL